MSPLALVEEASMSFCNNAQEAAAGPAAPALSPPAPAAHGSGDALAAAADAEANAALALPRRSADHPSSPAAPNKLPSPEAPCGMLDRLPQDLLRKVMDDQDARTTQVLLGASRALGRQVMALAPSRTLTRRIRPQQQQEQEQQEWPAGLGSLVTALSPPDLKLVIRSWVDEQLTCLRQPPPPDVWPSVTSLHLRSLEVTEDGLAALQLHHWPQLREVQVEGCNVDPSADRPASSLLQPLPHLHTLRFKGVVWADQLCYWVPLARGPSLRVLGLECVCQHLDTLLSAASDLTHVELGNPRAEDIRRLAQAPQLQHVTFGRISNLKEDLSALQCPWTSMCLEVLDMDCVQWLPLGPNLRTLTLRSVHGSRDPATTNAALSTLQYHQDNGLRVVVEGWGPGTSQHAQWRLGRQERAVEVRCCNADVLQWVASSCPQATALELSFPLDSWAKALPALQESGRVHTLCLETFNCTPEVAAALPACVRHVKAQGYTHSLACLAPFVAALPAHVQRLSLLCLQPTPPCLAQVEAAQGARQSPLALSVVCV